jgi:hypothetical protein
VPKQAPKGAVFCGLFTSRVHRYILFYLPSPASIVRHVLFCLANSRSLQEDCMGWRSLVPMPRFLLSSSLSRQSGCHNFSPVLLNCVVSHHLSCKSLSAPWKPSGMGKHPQYELPGTGSSCRDRVAHTSERKWPNNKDIMRTLSSNHSLQEQRQHPMWQAGGR